MGRQHFGRGSVTSASRSVRRGAVVWVDLEPTVGPEQNTLRPAVVVSNDSANLSATGRGRGVVTVVPLTRDVARILPIHTYVPAAESGLPHDSKAQAEQVRAVDVSRLRGVVRMLPRERMADLDEALLLHLDL